MAISSDGPAGWKCALSLSNDRSITSGSQEGLAAAIGRGADLRLYTEFKHEEHIAPGSPTPGINDPSNHGLIRESIDFRQSAVLDRSHVVGITVLRQPLEPTTGFNGTVPKLSFFMYNMTGEQSHANILLELNAGECAPGRQTVVPRDPSVPKMSEQAMFDVGTTGPSRNFIYDFERYRFFVRDDWQMVLSHDADGNVLDGSIEAVEQAQIRCQEFKVGIRGLWAPLGSGPDHEVFVNVGSGFYHTVRRNFETLSHPVLRVRPAVPMHFGSNIWDLCWVALRSDGVATVRRLDPYCREHSDERTRLACRWFVR